MDFKYYALLILVVQNSAYALLMVYTQSGKSAVEKYNSSTAVIMGEVIKMTICIVVTFFLNNCKPVETAAVLKDAFFKDPKDSMKLAVPAILYFLQNNLIYVAASNLDAATYQVVSQLKILTTAIFCITLLDKSLDTVKWISLVVLMVGVALVNYTPSNGENNSGRSPVIGLACLICASTVSGFAGVYFEKILKKTQQTLWMRNIQLSLFALVIGLPTILVKDSSTIIKNGVFHNYDFAVWVTIFVSAAGGLITAVVIKYADNIIKGFATSVAILVTAIFAYLFMDFELRWNFAAGCVLVLIAIHLYTKESDQHSSSLPQYNPVPSETLTKIRSRTHVNDKNPAL